MSEPVTVYSPAGEAVTVYAPSEVKKLVDGGYSYYPPELEIPAGDFPGATLPAQHLAEEHGLDITQIAGSGIDGRVTKADVQVAIDGNIK